MFLCQQSQLPILDLIGNAMLWMFDDVEYPGPGPGLVDLNVYLVVHKHHNGVHTVE